MLLPVLLATTAFTGLSSALAQTSEGGNGLETVIVTAEKRERTCRRFPSASRP